MRRIACLFVVLLAACAGAPPQPEVPIEERIAAVEGALMPGLVFAGEPAETQTLAERMEELHVPGVSVAVIRDGEIEWARGYGMADVESGRPVTPETLFQAASISKPVAALAALRLVQDGRIGLDDDVNTALTSWQVPANEFTEGAPVTLRRLLSHSAGTTVHGFPGYARDVEQPSTVDVLDGNGNTDPVRVDVEPGTLYRYSGGGYTVMQLLVADLHGKTFPEVMAETVLGPIGMSRSTYEQPLPESRWEEAATGYRADGSPVEGGWHVYPEMAPAGLWTTPSDLARYAIEVQHARVGESDAVITQATAEEMLRPVLSNHGLGPGIGNDGSTFGHGGANEGFRCNLVAALDGSWGMVVMTNGDAGGSLAREILLTLAREYGWPGPRPREVALVELTPEQLAPFAGGYEIPGFGVIEISVAEDRLRADLPDGRSAELRPMSEERFIDPDDGQEITFVFDGDEVTGADLGNIQATKVKD